MAVCISDKSLHNDIICCSNLKIYIIFELSLVLALVIDKRKNRFLSIKM